MWAGYHYAASSPSHVCVVVCVCGCGCVALCVGVCARAQVEFLKSSKHDAVAQVVLRLQPLQVTPGQYICHRGDIALEMYVPALLLHCLRGGSAPLMYSALCMCYQVVYYVRRGGGRR
mgnify:CR=1 FL=1